jgi:hypothetical protein
MGKSGYFAILKNRFATSFEIRKPGTQHQKIVGRGKRTQSHRGSVEKEEKA